MRGLKLQRRMRNIFSFLKLRQDEAPKSCSSAVSRTMADAAPSASSNELICLCRLRFAFLLMKESSGIKGEGTDVDRGDMRVSIDERHLKVLSKNIFNMEFCTRLRWLSYRLHAEFYDRRSTLPHLCVFWIFINHFIALRHSYSVEYIFVYIFERREIIDVCSLLRLPLHSTLSHRHTLTAHTQCEPIRSNIIILLLMLDRTFICTTL